MSEEKRQVPMLSKLILPGGPLPYPERERIKYLASLKLIPVTEIKSGLGFDFLILGGQMKIPVGDRGGTVPGLNEDKILAIQKRLKYPDLVVLSAFAMHIGFLPNDLKLSLPASCLIRAKNEFNQTVNKVKVRRALSFLKKKGFLLECNPVSQETYAREYPPTYNNHEEEVRSITFKK